MKKLLTMLLTAALLLAFSPVNHAARNKKTNHGKEIVHNGHYVNMGSDNNYYYIEFAFNLVTQHFGFFHISSPESDHSSYQDGTKISGDGDTTQGDGSDIKIITDNVVLEFDGGTKSVSIPLTDINHPAITFDW